MPSRVPDGVYAAALTPLHPDGSIDDDAFADHLRWLLDHGCDGVLVFGTTGEGFSFSTGERVRALDALLERGLPAGRLLVGSGALALPDAVSLTGAAVDREVGAVLVPPPFHLREVNDAGLVRFYDRLIREVDRSGLRLFFYHFPQLFGVPVSFVAIQRLLDAHPAAVAGVKDSSGEWDHTEALCRDFPSLQVFAGTERLLLPTLEAGGSGCISATANLSASLAGRLADRHRAGGDAASRELQELQETLRRVRSAFAPFPTIPALKQVLAWRHAAPAWATVRPPLAPFEDADKASEADLREVAAALDAAVGALPGRAAPVR
jgi:4-hydroxy-tetrahydrodipicolinate synthase